MGTELKQTAELGELNSGENRAQSQRRFLVQRLPQADSRIIDESTVLSRVPVSRRTWGNWKAQGLVPYIKIGRRCLYDWENVINALKRLERGGGQ
jgi:hypothetical protein